MAPLAKGFTYGQWSLVYNSLSFGIAGMGSATIFFWLQLANVTKNYRTALAITGIVTAIATYNYFGSSTRCAMPPTKAAVDAADEMVCKAIAALDAANAAARLAREAVLEAQHLASLVRHEHMTPIVVISPLLTPPPAGP